MQLAAKAGDRAGQASKQLSPRCSWLPTRLPAAWAGRVSRPLCPSIVLHEAGNRARALTQWLWVSSSGLWDMLLPLPGTACYLSPSSNEFPLILQIRNSDCMHARHSLSPPGLLTPLPYFLSPYLSCCLLGSSSRPMFRFTDSLFSCSLHGG